MEWNIQAPRLIHARRALAYFAGSVTNAWYPIDALNRTDADVSLFLLAANSIVYDAPVTDPLYAASTPYTYGNGTNSGYYQADLPVNALACTDRTYIRAEPSFLAMQSSRQTSIRT